MEANTEESAFPFFRRSGQKGNRTMRATQKDVAEPQTTWREDYAYTPGVQAYVFGLPYIDLASLRWNWVTVPKPAGNTTPYAPLNHFHNVRSLADGSYRDGGSPNNDTMYSIAWMDVGKEPIILSHSDMGDRYFTFELASMIRIISPMSPSAQPAVWLLTDSRIMAPKA